MSAPDHAPIDERALSKLRWRCRRGLLENDLLLERFFARMGDRISVSQERALLALMDLSDPDLLDLLLARKPPRPRAKQRRHPRDAATVAPHGAAGLARCPS